MENIEQFLTENEGVASVTELAILTGYTEGRVRAWARANQDRVRRLGSTFAFTHQSIIALLADLSAEDADAMDDDDPALDEATAPRPTPANSRCAPVRWATCSGTPPALR